MKIFIGGLSFSTTDDTLRIYFQTYGTITDAVVMKDSLSRRSRGFGFITFANPSSVDDVLNQPEHIIDNRRVEAKRAVPRADTGKAPDPASGFTRSPVLPPTNGDNGGTHHAPPSDSVFTGSSPPGVRGVATSTTDNSSDVLGPSHQQQLLAAGSPCTKIFVGGLHYETRDSQFRSYFEKFGNVISAEVMYNRETRNSRGFGFVVFESSSSAAAVLRSAHHAIGGKLVEVKPAIPRAPPAPLATANPPSVGPMLSLSPNHSTSHSSKPFPNGSLQDVASDKTVECFDGETYASALANGLTHIQKGGTGITQQKQLHTGQEAIGPRFLPQQSSSPSLCGLRGSGTNSQSCWRNLPKLTFARSEEHLYSNMREHEGEDLTPSPFLQKVMLNGQQHQGSSTPTSSPSFSRATSMDPIYDPQSLGNNLSPFLMDNSTTQYPLTNSNSCTSAEQWTNPSKERTAEGMIEAAMADLSLGFGLHDDVDSSSHTHAGLCLNYNNSLSAQTDDQVASPGDHIAAISRSISPPSEDHPVSCFGIL